MMSAHSTSSARSGASKPNLSRATVAMYFVQERKFGSYILRPLRSLAEMLGILRREECALMMIEPPGQARIGGVFEIDDGVFIAIEHAGLENLAGPMRQAGEHKFRIRMEFRFDKAAEKRRRSRAVEAMIVIEDSHPHG